MARRPTFIDLFAGIGGIRLGFERAGARCVFSCEWDKACQDTYEANFGKRPAGDIADVSSQEIPDHDILTAGFPCQPFSIIGAGRGFADTRGTLFFEVERIRFLARQHCQVISSRDITRRNLTRSLMLGGRTGPTIKLDGTRRSHRPTALRSAKIAVPCRQVMGAGHPISTPMRFGLNAQ